MAAGGANHGWRGGRLNNLDAMARALLLGPDAGLAQELRSDHRVPPFPPDDARPWPGEPAATGAHRTCSMVGAPVASIARRSNPMAMPLASGICARAARKSSSSG